MLRKQQSVPPTPAKILRAAQYVRMSTHLQRYSVENQAAMIAAYAAERSLEIVRTYVDRGRSGLGIDNRKELQALIADVQQRRADFSAVLVYDVSRWGRFQDIDESAYYEFICKKAGIKVLYCAEPFENDGSLVSAIMKNIKRVAAADYSRDLSARVFAGSCRVAKLGFKQGGTAGYGLRRVLVSPRGTRKCVLKRGEWKSQQSDRVILEPGPPSQVRNVRWAFRRFVVDRKSELTIARELNAKKQFNEFGRPWRMLAIRRLLTDEKYIGNYIYNRRSGKLKTPRKSNPEAEWIRSEGAIKAIVTRPTFAAAAKIIGARPKQTIRASLPDSEMLSRLAGLLAKEGRLCARLIDQARNVPCTMTYIMRFGSLRDAYRMIGYHPDAFQSFDARRAVTAKMLEVVTELTRKIQGLAISAKLDGASGRLSIGAGLTVSIALARCQRTLKGHLRWPIRRRIDAGADLVLAARMQEDNNSILDYYLMPRERVPRNGITFHQRRKHDLEPYRMRSLGDVARAIERYQGTSKKRSNGRAAIGTASVRMTQKQHR